MDKHEPRKELVKTALIVLLVFSAVFLANRAGVFSGLFSASGALSAVRSYMDTTGAASDDNPADNGNSLSCAAEPYCIVVSFENGGHHAVKYDAAALQRLNSQLLPVLGEALGSAADGVTVSRDDWERVLSGSGVLFDYLYAQPLSLLAAWQGIGMTGQAAGDSARRICLAADGDKLALYYIRESDGGFVKCATALYITAVTEKLSEFSALNDRFAFELGEAYSGLDPWYMILSELPQIHNLRCARPLMNASFAEKIMDTLGMNAAFATSYIEADGAEVYVEGNSTLRISSDGTVEFLDTGEDSSAGEPAIAMAEAVEQAYRLVADGPGAIIGDAKPGLSSVAFDEQTGSYTISFGYSAGGVPVSTSGDSAATIRITGSQVVSARLVYRGYFVDEGTALLLPELQAAGIVSAEGGSEVLLVYADSGDRALPGWERDWT